MATDASGAAAAGDDPEFPSLAGGPFGDAPAPPMPRIAADDPEASTKFSRYRTKLSTHRTGLSEGRTEMSMRRTGMSFQRTRLSADRTLMSVIRTSLSMISFGFTIYSFFHGISDKTPGAEGEGAARFFGQALVLLGIGILSIGIIYHLIFMSGLRHERGSMKSAALIHAESKFPISVTLVTAVLLLLLGIFAAVGIILRIGPFG